MSKNNKKIISIIVSILLVFFILYFLTSYIKTKEATPIPNPIVNSYVITTLEINGQRYEDEITTEMSVYDFMSKLRKEERIDFIEKNYTGIGKFIVSINGVSGDGSRNWIYYVNSVEAQVGVSNYKIKSGDIISWKYEKSNY